MFFKENIAIVGFSTDYNMKVAQLFAEKAKMRFFDFAKYMDYALICGTGEVISQMGIDFYLNAEKKKYKSVKDYCGTVLGTTSTALIDLSNLASISANHYIIYIRTNKTSLENRVKGDRTNYLRPLLKYSCLEADDKIAEYCDIVVDTYNVSKVKAARLAFDAFADFVGNMKEEII